MVRTDTNSLEKTKTAGVLQAIFTGRPATIQFRGKPMLTSIYKQPVEGPVMVRRLGVEGDEQADLRVHGGPDQAVYCYPAKHYARWQDELGRTLEFGAFGENLTVSGLVESSVRVGDVLAVGDAVLQVTRPRFPCFKLGIKFGDQRFVGRFQKSGRSGFYCRVLQEGMIEPGQPIRLAERDDSQPTIADVVASRDKEA
jgi:MOSC domain-containing protein YiiM